MAMHPEWSAFLDEYVSWFAPLEKARNQAWWDASLGDTTASGRLASLDRERAARHSDPETFARISAARQNGEFERLPDLTRRQLQMAYLAYAAEQRDPATLDAELALERRLRDTFNGFRATLDGEQADDNALDDILLHSTDSDRLRAAWEASKQVGAKVAPDLRALATLRNQSARRAGFETYWHRALLLREIEPARLEALLDEIDGVTDAPFRAAKRSLDERLAHRFGIALEDLRPWHYQDRFFQRAPLTEPDPLDAVAQRLDLIATAVRSFEGLGIDLHDVVERSDFLPRPGKSQHAFCIHVDRSGDVRVLLNVVPSARWLRTLLHELGHAAYEDLLDADLPFLVRDGAHALIHEGLAMLMEELVGDVAWLTRVAGMELAEAEASSRRIAEQKRLDRLTFIRWCLCIVRFERALYADPDQDLDALWWQEVQRSQLLSPPDARHAPDWASKIHLAEAPVYYQSYFLGQLFAAQLGRAVRDANDGAFAESGGVGRYLRERLFRLGANLEWEPTVERATGAPLDAQAFAAAVS